MALLRFQVSSRQPGGIAEDDCVNVLYYDVGVTDANSVKSVADDILSKYEAAFFPNVPYATWTCRGYDMADLKPRPVKGEATRLFGGNGAQAPREVAICLSYYAQRNLPRQRGRIFIGPFLASSVAERNPSVGFIDRVMTLGRGLASVGESAIVPDSEWVVYSPTNRTSLPIRNIWADNAWDTQRRRGAKATARQTAAVD